MERILELIDAANAAEAEARDQLQVLNTFKGARAIAEKLCYYPGTSEYRIAIDVACRVFEEYNIQTNVWGIITSLEKK
jgi:hypothetical protein